MTTAARVRSGAAATVALLSLPPPADCRNRCRRRRLGQDPPTSRDTEDAAKEGRVVRVETEWGKKVCVRERESGERREGESGAGELRDEAKTHNLLLHCRCLR